MFLNRQLTQEEGKKDLDSLTSSLVYAYLRSFDPPKQHSFTALYVPLLNIPAADLRLRPEFNELFRHADIRAQDLVTLDDLPSLEMAEQVLRPEDTRWILVDHNKLQGQLGSVYNSRVHGVIDHHDDEDSIPQDLEPEPRVIEKCGSCTSLVIRTLRSSWDAVSRGIPSTSLSTSQRQAEGSSTEDSAVSKLWDAQLAKIALASILIDTANLKAEGKVEAADSEAVQYLESKIVSPTNESTGMEWDRTQFYNSLKTAKQNIDFLSLNDILRKDYKQWPSAAHPSTVLGISSVVKPLFFLTTRAIQENPEAEKKAFDQAIQTFMQERHLSLYAIMTSFSTHESGHNRELFLQASSISPSGDSPQTTAASAAASRFASQSQAELGLEPLHVPGIEDIASIDDDDDDDDHHDNRANESTRHVWAQKEVDKSRKQVAPLLRQALE